MYLIIGIICYIYLSIKIKIKENLDHMIYFDKRKRRARKKKEKGWVV